MNILLLYPKFPDSFWSMRHALRFVRRKSAMPPLGLLTVAALLPETWTMRLVDTNIAALRASDLEWADMAMLSAMNTQKSAAQKLVARCQDAGVTTIVGGPLVTIEPDAFPTADHLILNEAEVTLPEFLADFAEGRARRIYASSEFADLNTSPLPRWDLLDIKRYFLMGIQYSRGCPFNCDFCSVTTLLGSTTRVKSPEQILAELDGLHEAGWREGVFFVDDNLVGNKRATRTELLPALSSWQTRHPKTAYCFNTQASINIADDPALLAALAAAGFNSVFIGIETPNDNSLAECGKVQNRRRDLAASVRTIQHAGIEVQGGFIVGFDSDDISIFHRQIEFIQRTGIVTAMVGLLQAIPGTRLHERMLDEGRVIGSPSGDNVDGTTNLLPQMGLETLNDGYRKILKSIYSPRGYYKRLRTFLREYPVPRVAPPLDKTRIFALLRSFVQLGMISNGRLGYWRMLLWTLVRRPRHFGRAVTLSITGHHYRTICKSILASPRIR